MSETAGTLRALLWGKLFSSDMGESEPRVQDRLRDSALCRGLSNAEVKKVARKLHHRLYRSGETIYEKGHPGAALYIVDAGSVIATMPNANGGETELANFGPGNLFGYISLISDKPRPISITTAEPTELWALARTDFEAVIASDPRLGVKLLRNLVVLTSECMEPIIGENGGLDADDRHTAER